MKRFKQFYEKKLFRGFDKGDTLYGKNPLVWFSYDKKVADGYAYYRKNAEVDSIDYNPTNTFDVGNSEKRMKITELLNLIMTQKSKNTDLEKLKPIYMRLKKTFGEKVQSIDEFWYDSKDFATFLELCGYDSILAKEDGFKTLGILRKKLP